MLLHGSQETKDKMDCNKFFETDTNEIQNITTNLTSTFTSVADETVEFSNNEVGITDTLKETKKFTTSKDVPGKRPLPRPRMKTRSEECVSINEPTKASEQQYHGQQKNYKNINDTVCEREDEKFEISQGLRRSTLSKIRKGQDTIIEQDGNYEKVVDHQCNDNEMLRFDHNDEPQILEETNNDQQEKIINKNYEDSYLMKSESDSKKIIGIFIHRSDCLQPDMLIQHPVVKVYLLNANTGKYLKKSNPEQPASFCYENKDTDFILPLMTKNFDFRINRSLIPTWNELLLFNEDIQYILKDEPTVLIMFEILDFVSFSIASSQYKKLGPEGGWHKIAWAFLKPVGANQLYNVEKKLRLQLYKPILSNRTRNEHCDIYSWWSQQIWERYPATLYVTVKGVIPPNNLLPALRSQVVLQEEKTSNTLDFCQQEDTKSISEDRRGILNQELCNEQIQSCPVWSRLPAQSCKIPNEIKLSIHTPPKGCFVVKFSNSGLLLACTMANEDIFSINLYTISDGTLYASFFGHRGLIYDLSWSSSDSMLLSASADCTVCIWDVEKKRTNCLQMLPHPSFVYSAKFNGQKSWLLATGCNDHIVRLWVRQHKANQYDLIQELDGHQGFINSLSFLQENGLLSADSVGSILLWSCNHSFSRNNLVLWVKSRQFCVRELKGVVINKVIVHPGGQRLLIHSRDNLLRMLDITTGIVIQWFQGAIIHRIQSSSCLSPCGGLVFAGSEDGSVCVWNADTGHLCALYSGLNYYSTVTCIDYHPFEHMVAFSSHGSSSLVLVCGYNKLSNGFEVGLQLLSHKMLLNKTMHKDQSANRNHIDAKTSTFLKNTLKGNDTENADLINSENEGSTSGFWNSTSESSCKLKSPHEGNSSKRKVDLMYLISQIDELLK